MSEKTNTINYSEVAGHFQEANENTDQARTNALTGLLAIRVAKQNYLEREQKRLTEKLGPGDPRVKTLEVRLQRDGEMIRDLQWGLDRSASQERDVPTDRWILHGRVFDQKSQPVAGLTVALDTNKGESFAKSVQSDKTGHFRLIHTPQSETDTKRDTVTKPDTIPGQGRPQAERERYRVPPQDLVLTIMDKEGVALKRQTLALEVELGGSTYIEVFLSDEPVKDAPPIQRKASKRTKTEKGKSKKKKSKKKN